MQLEKFLVSILMVIFAAFLFPTLQTECANASVTSLGPLIQAFPTIFLVVVIAFPVYYAVSEGKS